MGEVVQASQAFKEQNGLANRHNIGPVSCTLLKKRHLIALKAQSGQWNSLSARIRIIDLETAGNGPNDVCEIGWQDVALDDNGRWSLNEERGALFVNPGSPISPETMAVHHILDSDVAGAPIWK